MILKIFLHHYLRNDVIFLLIHQLYITNQNILSLYMLRKIATFNILYDVKYFSS